MPNCLERLFLAFCFLVEDIGEKKKLATMSYLVELETHLDTNKSSTTGMQKQIQSRFKTTVVCMY